MPISRMTVGSLQDLGYTVNYAAADAYTLPGGAPSGVIIGDAGNNNLVGTASGDTILGLGGNDTLAGVGGNDTLDGGTGNDFIDGGAGTTPRCSPAISANYALADLGVRITISGPDGSDTLVGDRASALRRRHDPSSTTAARCSTRCSTDRNYLDVFHAGVDALAHFNSFGRAGGARPERVLLDALWYLSLNPDVRGERRQSARPYHQTGWREGRDPSRRISTRRST